MAGFRKKEKVKSAISFLLIFNIMLALISCDGAKTRPVLPAVSVTPLPKSGSLLFPSNPVIPLSPKFSATVVIPGTGVKAGDEFQVEVRITSEIPSRGAQCALKFDPAQMKCEGVIEGSYYRDWANDNGCTTINFPEAKIDNTAGKVSDYGLAVMGSKAGGVIGSGVFSSYTFMALTNTLTQPEIFDVLVSDASGSIYRATLK
jgi:hypothetical protein